MYVRIAETRQQHLALEIDDCGIRTDQGVDLLVRADGNDPTVTDRHRLGPRLGGNDRVDGPVAEHQVSRIRRIGAGNGEKQDCQRNGRVCSKHAHCYLLSTARPHERRTLKIVSICSRVRINGGDSTLR